MLEALRRSAGLDQGAAAVTSDDLFGDILSDVEGGERPPVTPPAASPPPSSVDRALAEILESTKAAPSPKRGGDVSADVDKMLSDTLSGLEVRPRKPAPALPEELVERISRDLTAKERAQLDAALSYPEDSVGARMDFEPLSIRDDVTLEVVLRYLRRFDELPGHTDQVFVVDREGLLKGALPLDRLLINEPDTEVAAVMKTDILTLSPVDDAGDAAQAFERYDLVSAPVVDANGRLVGRLTVDEVVDVIREEADHSVMSMAGLDEDADMFAGVVPSARRRGVWLGVNLGTAFLAAWVVGLFESTIQNIVALAVLMPIVASMGGVAATQTLTLIVRGLALGQVERANARWLLTKEVAVALLNGLAWATVVAAVAFLWYRNWKIAGVIFAAMVVNLFAAALAGVLVPLTLKRLGVDPAVAGGVVVTTVTDVIGFASLLGLGTWVLM